MAIKYDKLFKLFEEKGITTYKIRKENIIAKSFKIENKLKSIILK